LGTLPDSGKMPLRGVYVKVFSGRLSFCGHG
jgi:hypothetical protein